MAAPYTTSLTQAYPLLSGISGPEDLKKLSIPELERVAAECRKRVIELVSMNGGHFGSSLGVVELTVAMHHVYDSPRDRIVWDVGHQAYV
ncbi:MAG: 1-deoxy-D-xylulose-5-phosphate synthase, partial [Chlorobiales bacterium]|nr:1-deoxy-D-xylulose-5-phosphate synthase [Chlorobiales bacterium]